MKLVTFNQVDYERTRFGNIDLEMYRSDKLGFKYKTVEEFVYEFTPTFLSENLKKAITRAFSENGSVTFNYGCGNQTFYFSEV